MGARILVVDDDRSMCQWLEQSLPGLGFTVSTSTDSDQALAQLDRGDFDVVVADVNMRGMSGLELAGRLRARRPDIPVVLITAFGSLDTAVEAIRAGAYDFITKPFEVEQLGVALERAAEHRALTAEVRRLRRAVEDTQHFEEIVGQSPPMVALYDRLARIADSDASVLLTGESGVGKSELALELISRGHRLIADDAAQLHRLAPDTLKGVCPPVLRDFLEVRGLGVLNIRAMFGDRAIKHDKNLRLVIHLEKMAARQLRAVDRLHGSRQSREIHGVVVPQVTLPVVSGLNLAVLVECAVRNHILHMEGYNADLDFIERQQQYLAHNKS